MGSSRGLTGSVKKIKEKKSKESLIIKIHPQKKN